MHGSWLRLTFPKRAALTALVAFAANVASAQNVVFSGKVSTEGGQPLAGANVGITEIGVGTVAATDGKYSFTVDQARLRGRTLNVTARFIGYKPKRMPVTISGNRVDHDFVLERDVLNLEEVVVTGTSAATEQKKTAFTVNVVDNTQIKEAPATSPIASLEGKIPGAQVITQSGQPGGEPAIRLRSATSLTGRTDPLIIVDGVITNLGMADINSEDIERVEVVKGAAASSLYGSNAANGVVQIFTKRGANIAEGQTIFSTRHEYGRNDLPNVVPGNQHHNYQVTTSGGAVQYLLNDNGDRQDAPDKIADRPYPVYYDQFNLIFKPGDFLTDYVSAGQRRGSTNFNVSFQNTHESGVVKQLNGFQRENFRINVDQALTEKIDLGVGAFYGRSTADQGEAVFPWFGLRFLEPDIKIDSVDAKGNYIAAINRPPLSGNVSNPLYVTQQDKNSNDRDRFTGTFKGTYRMLNWLTADGNVGYDVANQTSKAFSPLGFTSSSGIKSSGSLNEQSDNDRSYNLGATLTSVREFGSAIHNTTKVAWAYEDQTNQFVGAYAPSLSVVQVTEFAAAAQSADNPVQPRSITQQIRANNYFAVTTFDVKDRYIVDGLIRRDQSSLFGADSRSATYHRISGAYRLTQDFHLPHIDELKLRASVGTAGLRPPFEAQYETYALVGGNPEKVTLGNRELKPAFSKETELGFNVNFLNNYTFEYSYSARSTSDQIMQVPLSSATGYKFQWQNAATLDGHTHEFALGAVLLSKADYFWRVNLTADRSRGSVTDLKVPAFFIGPDANTAMFHIAKGEQLGTIYGVRWIKSQEQLEETIKAGGLKGTAADYVQNEEGFYVTKSSYHTVDEKPLKAWKCADAGCTSSSINQIIGDVNPKFNFGLSSNAQWKALTFSGVLTWLNGGNIYNMTRQWPFNELRDTVIDQSKKPAATAANGGPCPALTVDSHCPYSTGKKPTTYYSTFYDGLNPGDYFVEDGTFLRIRELAVNWQLPQKWIDKLPGNFHTARLGLVGRNLWTHTKYSGYNPDVSGVTGSGGGNPFVYRVDYFQYPAFRTFTGMFELGF